jgi:hypothetical protein
MKAFDTPNITTGKEHDIKAHGYEAVGIYLRPDRATPASIKALRNAGLKIFSIWEKGRPTSVKYFTANQGIKDATAAIVFAKKIKQPSGTQIFTCVDYDAQWKTDGAEITEYFRTFHNTVKAAGYLASVYGSGTVCKHLVSAGWAHSGFLSQSSGWSGYKEFAPRATIKQGITTVLLGLDIDLDTVVDPNVCW